MSSSSNISIPNDRYDIERQIIEQEIKRLEERLTTAETTPTSYPTTIPLSANDLHTATRQSVNEEEAQARAQILALKARYNTYSRLTRLPDELIQEIFIIASQAAGRWSIGRTALKISWICHTWRVIAHRSSALWSFIDFRHPEWVYTALSRTRKHPLDIFVDFPDGHRPVMVIFLWLCLQRFSQVRTLNIKADITSPLQSTPALDQMWANPASSLVNLSLVCVTLPSNPFAGTIPALQNLFLAGCSFNWRSFRLPRGVKSVVIRHPRSRIPANKFMDIIRVISPEIEAICLYDALSPSEILPDHSQGRHELPSIKEFQLYEGDPSPITTLLNQVTFSSPYVKLIDIDVQNGIEQLETAKALVSARRLNPWPGSFLDVSLEDDDLYIAVKEERPDDEPFVYVNCVQLNLDVNGNPMAFLPVFDILPIPPFIKKLQIAGSYVEDVSRAQLMSRLGGYESVQEITAIRWFIPVFSWVIKTQVDRLREVGGLDDGVEVDDSLKEQLRAIITFHGLSTLIYDGEEIDIGEPQLVFHKELVCIAEWLRWRRLVGLPVEKLVFKTIEIDDAIDFEDIFGDVVDEIEEREIEWVGSSDEEDDEDEDEDEEQGQGQDADVEVNHGGDL